MDDPVDRVIEADELVANAEFNLWARVADARLAGVTWQELGEALGVTRQAVWQRFGVERALEKLHGAHRPLQDEALPGFEAEGE